jgi:hypothetical protein
MASGTFVREIAAKYGVHRVALTNHVRAAGMKPCSRGLEQPATNEATRLYTDEEW